jgi:hypothetical protein
MTIKVYADRIEIGAKTITTTPTGIRIGDSLAANTQQQGYINQANFTARELAFGNFVFQGSVAGFISGGVTPPSGTTVNIIEKFPFATATTGVSDVGDLTSSRRLPSGQSSTVSGYSGGGQVTPPGQVNTLDKFSFANNGNATDVGDLAPTAGQYGPTGCSSSTNGYSVTNTISKYPFATDSNATDIGNGNSHIEGAGGHSSDTHGYLSGGYAIPVVGNRISKFPFASDTSAITNSSFPSFSIYGVAGQSSTTHGYTGGGLGSVPGGPPYSLVNTIYKFPFADDSVATDIGDITDAKQFNTGQSSTTHGYTCGGDLGPPGPVRSNTIDRFPFSADTNASDVGDLSATRAQAAGQQF